MKMVAARRFSGILPLQHRSGAPALLPSYDRPMAITGLSRRGQGLLAKPPLPEYVREHLSRLDSAYDRVTNPGGYVPLSVAENLLLGDPLLERLAAVRDVPARVLGYDSMVGSARFRRRLARFLSRAVLGRAVAPEQVAVLAGAGSVLEVLFHCLCDPGDGVLVPTPSYAGFWADLETRDELSIVEVPTARAEGFKLTPDHLDRALATAGRPVKALLFTSPNNPLGTVASAEDIEQILSWAKAAEVHVVFDEIYALSVFGDRPFTSCAQVAGKLGDSVHVVWAFSKDFGASGLRCGVLVSDNRELLAAVDGLAYWACCSGHTQHLLAEMISDDAWVDGYVRRNRAVLGDAYRQVTAALEQAAIPFFPAAAGFFLLIDLRRWLGEATWEAEDALWRRLLNEGNVNLTPGKACRNPQPGLFRLCFAAVPAEAVVTGVRRVGAVLSGA